MQLYSTVTLCTVHVVAFLLLIADRKSTGSVHPAASAAVAMTSSRRVRRQASLGTSGEPDTPDTGGSRQPTAENTEMDDEMMSVEIDQYEKNGANENVDQTMFFESSGKASGQSKMSFQDNLVGRLS